MYLDMNCEGKQENNEKYKFYCKQLYVIIKLEFDYQKVLKIKKICLT